MKVTYADGVFEELVSLSFYLAETDEETAHRFLDACDQTFLFLADNRLIGSLIKFTSVKLNEVRMWRVKGFEKYLVFYEPQSDGIKILHILHIAQDYNRVFEDE
jgi:toxin ParE1/3/4